MTSPLRLAGLFGTVLALTLPVAACSDDSGASGSSGSSGSVDPSCSCSITANGENEKISCGQSACIAGSSFECGAGAAITRGGTACDAAPSGSDAGPAPAPTATTVTCPYSGDGIGSAEDTCDAKTEYCILAKNGGSAAMCAPLPSGCHACGCANANADAAWRAGNNNTANCGRSTLGQATVSCTDTNGALTVICK